MVKGPQNKENVHHQEICVGELYEDGPRLINAEWCHTLESQIGVDIIISFWMVCPRKLQRLHTFLNSNRTSYERTLDSSNQFYSCESTGARSKSEYPRKVSQHALKYCQFAATVKKTQPRAGTLLCDAGCNIIVLLRLAISFILTPSPTTTTGRPTRQVSAVVNLYFATRKL